MLIFTCRGCEMVTGATVGHCAQDRQSKSSQTVSAFLSTHLLGMVLWPGCVCQLCLPVFSTTLLNQASANSLNQINQALFIQHISGMKCNAMCFTEEKKQEKKTMEIKTEIFTIQQT